MFFKRKCNHPADRLHVDKEATVENIDNDFDHVTYHLICTNCNSPVKIVYARMIGGVDAFLKRGGVNTHVG